MITDKKRIIVTIPAYNEEQTLPPVLEEIHQALKGKYSYKILVVNDGSQDRTAEVAKQGGAVVISHRKNKGLAETFLTEMRECLQLKADIIVHTDADGQYPASYIPQMIARVEQGADLVIGARFGEGNYSGSLFKKVGNIAFAKALSGLLKTKLTDTTTGFRAFTAEVAELPLINSFTYTQEQLIRAGKAKMRIEEIPINTRKTRESRLFRNPFDYALKAWINIFRIYRDFEPLKFFGRIGIIFLLTGMILGLWVVYSVITAGNVGGIPRVILSAVLILAGVQIILFGFLADMFRR